jgi:hypothetical protein
MGSFNRFIVSRLGFLPLPLHDARRIVTNATVNLAGSGGIVASDSAPALARTNGATDPSLRLAWAASSSVEVQWNVVAPADLDANFPVLVKLFAAMGGTTDTPTITVAFFAGVGGTNGGSATAAVSGTTPATKTVTVAASNIGAAGTPWNITLVPGAHTTDALYVYDVRLEYTRR